MSHIFQRPLCEMGRAYDFAFRPVLGEPPFEHGGPCDERPHGVELLAARDQKGSASAVWQTFLLCPEHEGQLRKDDARMPAGSRFREDGPVALRSDGGRR